MNFNYHRMYIDPLEDSFERAARERRFSTFTLIPDLFEVCQPPRGREASTGWSPWYPIESVVISECRGHLDHPSYWIFRGAYFLLTEPYNSELYDYRHPSLSTIGIPTNVAPYCGRWSKFVGDAPGTKSFMITRSGNDSLLDQLDSELMRLDAVAPAWNDEAGF